MKKYSTLLAIVLLLVMVAPSLAYNDATGNVVDSKESDPWVYGGEVWIYNTVSGTICATGLLSGTGTFTLPLDGSVDALGVGITATCIGGANNGQVLEILIDFNCGMGVGACTPPNGYPGTYTRQFTQNAIPITFNAGYLYTGTGPTAVTLQGFDGGTTGSLPVMAGLAVVLLAGLTMFVVRRRQI
ncbi:MAG: hypothetical protein IAE79_18155 [Anaerolinea sp.]|nr:hypothetical protein [Anaerolinea sp.]